MFWEFILPFLVVCVVCYILLSKFKYGVDVHISKSNVLLNEFASGDLALNHLRSQFEKKANINTRKIKLNINSNNKNNEKQKNLNNTAPELRLDTCSAMKTDSCPLGSYKQCTNNVMNHKKCDCSDQKSFEVCSDNDMNDLLKMDQVLQNEPKDFGKFATRVNKWTVGKTDFIEDNV